MQAPVPVLRCYAGSMMTARAYCDWKRARNLLGPNGIDGDSVDRCPVNVYCSTGIVVCSWVIVVYLIYALALADSVRHPSRDAQAWKHS